MKDFLSKWKLADPKAILWDLLKTLEVHSCKTKKFCEISWKNHSKLTISKTKQLCKTSLKNEELSAELVASCQCVVWFLLPMWAMRAMSKTLLAFLLTLKSLLRLFSSLFRGLRFGFCKGSCFLFSCGAFAATHFAGIFAELSRQLIFAELV